MLSAQKKFVPPAEQPAVTHAGELVRFSDLKKHHEAEVIADTHGFTGKQREQFIIQSVKFAQHLEAAMQRKQPPTSQPVPYGYTPMAQQQQSGGLLRKGPSQN